VPQPPRQTPEGLAKARAARAAKASNEPHVFMEDDAWQQLARKHKVRLPQHGTALTTAGITQWLKKLGISSTEFRTWTGGMGFKQFLEANPIWNLRGFVGLMLEHIDQRPA
jgi:hypothetical protein